MINFFYSLFVLLLIGVAVVQNMLLIAGFLALLFTIKFSSASLVVLAIGIDAYFGAFETMPYFSVIALCWYVCSELIRLRIRIID